MLVTVRNPTNFPRHGFVSIPWLPLTKNEISPESHVRVEYNGRPLARVQIDKIRIASDPKNDDASFWELCVFVDYMERGGYVEGNPIFLDVLFSEPGAPPPASMPASTPVPPPPKKLPCVTVTSDGVELEGERIFAYLRLPAGIPPDDNYQGGAFTSIRLNHREILDAFKAEEHPWLEHDPEKRLQLDRVLLPNDPLSEKPLTIVKLYDRDWEYVSSGEGPARAWVVVKSPVVEYGSFRANLFRVISLYADADYLIEDIFVRTTSENGEPQPEGRVCFAPHFFLKMNFDLSPLMTITRVPQIPDWFSIATHRFPNQAYGFAANVAAGRIDNPPRDYPRPNKHSSFGWECGFTADRVRCMHLFARRIPPNYAADETGRKWFDLIYKPPEVSEVWTERTTVETEHV